jgi:hypothetical protein
MVKREKLDKKYNILIPEISRISERKISKADSIGKEQFKYYCVFNYEKS